jgi:hypothetical protein
MGKEFPWPIWAIGWLALFKAFLWLSYEPVQPGSLLTILGAKYLLNMVPMAVFAIGLWNLEVYIYSVILSGITLLCNGPLGDIFILLAAPIMLKHAKK